MVVMLGVDVHKDTHTTVAADEVGRQLGERLVRATDAGHRQLVTWARQQFGDDAHGERVWAIEDCRRMSTRLERALLAAGERVVRVPPKLMAGARDSARTRGKSDPIDALAIARAALREPNLPAAAHDQVSRELKLLVDHRENLVGERTRMLNRLRWHLHELDPELEIPGRRLDRLAQLDALAEWLDDRSDPGMVGRLAAELVVDIRGLSVRITALEKEITGRAQVAAPQLIGLPGAGGLTTAKIIGETANVARFRSESCFAMHAGVAPIPASSGRTQRHRLARGGNRQLNAALHRIAITQIRITNSPGRAYYQRRRANGDTSMEAIRALKRRLARVVFNLLQRAMSADSSQLPTMA